MRSVTCVVMYSLANVGDTTCICCRFMGYGRGRASVGGAKRHRYRLIGYSSKTVGAYTAQIDKQLFFGDKILDFESDFRKCGSVGNVAVPPWNTVCEFGANWYRNGREIRQATSGVRKFALEDMQQDVCQH